jgi:hypothetical protein
VAILRAYALSSEFFNSAGQGLCGLEQSPDLQPAWSYPYLPHQESDLELFHRRTTHYGSTLLASIFTRKKRKCERCRATGFRDRTLTSFWTNFLEFTHIGARHTGRHISLPGPSIFVSCFNRVEVCTSSGHGIFKLQRQNHFSFIFSLTGKSLHLREKGRETRSPPFSCLALPNSPRIFPTQPNPIRLTPCPARTVAKSLSCKSPTFSPPSNSTWNKGTTTGKRLQAGKK